MSVAAQSTHLHYFEHGAQLSPERSSEPTPLRQLEAFIKPVTAPVLSLLLICHCLLTAFSNCPFIAIVPLLNWGVYLFFLTSNRVSQS